jgi:hypothetical protein
VAEFGRVSEAGKVELVGFRLKLSHSVGIARKLERSQRRRAPALPSAKRGRAAASRQQKRLRPRSAEARGHGEIAIAKSATAFLRVRYSCSQFSQLGSLTCTR